MVDAGLLYFRGVHRGDLATEVKETTAVKVQVARIGKPHGIKGEVTVQLYTDSPEARMAKGAEFVLEPPHPLAPHGTVTISSARWNKSIMVLGFREVRTRNDAEALREHRLVLDTDTEEDSTEGYYEHELEGLDVYVVSSPDETELTEPVGTVAELQTMPTQDLLTVTLHDGTEALIPFVEEIVPDVDLEQGFVVLCPPPGLLTVNSDDEDDEAAQ